jgi:molecular chaperone GrpE (heat shock protein)
MPNHDAENIELDLDAELRGLFVQAEQAAGEQRPAPTKPTAEGKEAAKADEERALRTALPQMLKPMVIGLAAMTRAMGESTALLRKLDSINDDAIEARKVLPQLACDMQTALEHKNGLTKHMFDAMHEELKGYKDSFLLEAVHKPVILDLVSLYDDLSEILRQAQQAVGDARGGESGIPVAFGDRLHRLEVHVAHNCDFILEVLARLDVSPLPLSSGKLDKRTQRAIGVETTEIQEDDAEVIRSVKRGFLWKARLVRPEEVIIKKWKAPAPPLAST